MMDENKIYIFKQGKYEIDFKEKNVIVRVNDATGIIVWFDEIKELYELIFNPNSPIFKELIEKRCKNE